MTICVVDTSVFCNVLGVLGRNQHQRECLDALRDFRANGIFLMLPLAVVFETGTHIAHLAHGSVRRSTAEKFVAQVQQAVDGRAPWVATPLPAPATLSGWIEGFPDAAMRGLTLADLSIVEVFEQQCARHPARRVFIWSLDTHLQGYDRTVA